MPQHSDQEKLNVHIVDPDEAHSLKVSAMLERFGYATITYTSAEDFLDSGLDPSSGGCIVSEMELPGISGMELLSLLRERDFPQPFIVLTSDPDIPRAVNALRSKVSNYLLKPLIGRDLANTIETAMMEGASSKG